MDKVATTTTSRRPKWQYPNAQKTPRILHLPRRKSTPAKATKSSRKVKLETLFDEDREFSRGCFPVVMVSGNNYEERRERVEVRESEAVEEEKWRFQAEILRAECNFLRMEREIAVKKMERRRVQVERALRSSVQTLLSGRDRICEGKNESIVLEEEITELVKKLEKLQRISKHKDLEVRNCSNFDKQASILQSRLEKFAGEANGIYIKEIQEMAEAIFLSISENLASNSCNKMEIPSENLLERMKIEHGSKRQRLFAFSFDNEKYKTCCKCCKAIAQRVVDQIRAETAQWSQMQEILGQVREEMEELQASRAFWEDKAYNSNHEVQSLNRVAKEWRRKALASKAKEAELQTKVSMLEAENEKLRNESDNGKKNLVHDSHESTKEMDKRVMLVRRLKENRKTTNALSNKGYNASNRTLFREIGNSSPLLMQNNNKSNRGTLFHLHCPQPMNEERT